MSCINNEALLETFFEEAMEEYSHLGEEFCEVIARTKFEDYSN